MVEVSWTQLKAFVVARGLSVQWVDLDVRYWLAAFDSGLSLETFLHKTAASDATDLADFETNFKASGNQSVIQRYPDGRELMHSTPRKRGLTSYFAGVEDDATDPHKVGGGAQKLSVLHEVGGATPQTIYCNLNTINNETNLHSGTIQWQGAKHDLLTLEVVPKVTTTAAGTGTNYNLYGGYLVLPASPGTGTLTVLDADRVLVQVPTNEFGKKTGAGYFDAVWNTTTKVFDSIVPNYSGTGSFNMFAAEVALDRFVNTQAMLGAGVFTFHSHDASMIGHGMRFRLTSTTVGVDHEWSWCVSLILHRKKTV